VTYTDEELVRGCQRNDRHYQEALYRKYFASMMRMTMRYAHSQEQGVDIVNNGMMRVYKKIGQYSFKGSLEGWIRKLVYHSMADYFRKYNREVRFLELEDRDEARTPDGLNNLYVEDLLDLVERLPPATQEVFKLYAIEGYKHQEIANHLGISEGTSKWHLSTARQKLKELIEQHYDKVRVMRKG